MGYVDAVQRSNIETPNVLLTMKPAERVEILFWYYFFMANQAENLVPSVTAPSPQSLASEDLGQELDLTARLLIGPKSNLLLGYLHFWRGIKIIAPSDVDFLYSRWELDF